QSLFRQEGSKHPQYREFWHLSRATHGCSAENEVGIGGATLRRRCPACRQWEQGYLPERTLKERSCGPETSAKSNEPSLSRRTNAGAPSLEPQRSQLFSQVGPKTEREP